MLCFVRNQRSNSNRDEEEKIVNEIEAQPQDQVLALAEESKIVVPVDKPLNNKVQQRLMLPMKNLLTCLVCSKSKHKKAKGWKGWDLVEDDTVKADLVAIQEVDVMAGIRQSKRKRG
ncbi:hypothetical protein DFH28DRAFT_920759 [Melampsora americana]|nr:hypothetical protein DFH28DRAFT_920759 [Melampsora americana]